MFSINKCSSLLHSRVPGGSYSRFSTKDLETRFMALIPSYLTCLFKVLYITTNSSFYLYFLHWNFLSRSNSRPFILFIHKSFSPVLSPNLTQHLSKSSGLLHVPYLFHLIHLFHSIHLFRRDPLNCTRQSTSPSPAPLLPFASPPFPTRQPISPTQPSPPHISWQALIAHSFFFYHQSRQSIAKIKIKTNWKRSLHKHCPHICFYHCHFLSMLGVCVCHWRGMSVSMSFRGNIKKKKKMFDALVWERIRS